MVALIVLGLASGARAQRAGDDAEGRRQEGAVASAAIAEGVAEETDDDTSGWTALPVVMYTPETQLGVGAFGLHYFRIGDDGLETRPSSVAAVAYYTTRGQAMAELMPELYWDEGRWHLWTKFDYRFFPAFFWGVGNDMPDSAEERYDLESFRARAWLRHRMGRSLYIGPALDLQHVDFSNTTPNGSFAAGMVPGDAGGNTLGIGFTVGIDTRDRATQTLSGAFYQVTMMAFPPVLGDYPFARLIVDLRHFFRIYEDHAIAVQLYGELNGGDVPFYQMALLGGQNRLRGYFEGRYRDEGLWTAQVEYRYPLFWRFSGVAFFAAGDVFPRAQDIDLAQTKWAGGAGLRFALSRVERLNLRLDVGVGPGTAGLYFGVAEAF